MKSKISMFILAAVLSLGITIGIGTVFAGGDDESYKVQQKVDIEQDCDQKNVNEDSEGAILDNLQACTALGLNLNDIELGTEPDFELPPTDFTTPIVP